ncbi:MAG TPA: hypothetical protein PKE00_07540 [Planctomycetota bacterium]|nr:hypothetical protein [Planctomycetota bacterium]
MVFQRYLAFLASILLATVLHSHHVCAECWRAEAAASSFAASEASATHDFDRNAQSVQGADHDPCSGLCDIEGAAVRADIQDEVVVPGLDHEAGWVAWPTPPRAKRPPPLSALRIRPPPGEPRLRALHKLEGRARCLLQ